MNVRKLILGLLDMAVKVAFVVFVVVLISRYSKVAYNYGYRIFNQIPVSSGTGRTVTVTISASDSASDIAEKLSSAGLITDKMLFRLQEKFSDYQGLETPGVYELSTAMTTEEMLQIMAAGSSEVSGTDTAAKESADENSGSSDSGEEATTGETNAGEESNGG